MKLVAKQEAIIDELTIILEQSEQSSESSENSTENYLKQELKKLQKICAENNEKIVKLKVGCFVKLFSKLFLGRKSKISTKNRKNQIRKIGRLNFC